MGKSNIVCFLLQLERERGKKKCLTLAAYFLCLETLAFLPATLSILYIENPKDSIRKLLQLTSEFSKVTG